MKNKARFYITLGAVCAAFCVLAFAIPFVKNAVFWLAFAFGVVAIAVQFYSFPKAFGSGESVKSKFYGFPIVNLTVIYLVAQLVLSLLFMALAKWAPVWVEVVVCALLLLAALVGFVAADAMREEIQRQDAGIQKSVGNLRALQSRVRTLAGMDSGVSAQLAELSDAFRFSDPVSSDATVPLEKELAVMVDELQTAVSDGDDAAAAALCRRCSATLAERNRVCKLNK